MKTLLILVTVLAATATELRRSCGRNSEWGYGVTNGPDTWTDAYPTCGGNRQSPVALVTDEAFPATWEPLEFTRYNVHPHLMTVTNTGHSVQVSVDYDASVSGGNLPDEYAVAQFHFHWGAANTRGSEHTVDGERFAAELHLVHYLKFYGSMDEALKHDNGVAVFSVLLELSSHDNPVLESIVDSLTNLTYPGDFASAAGVPLHDILPSNTEDFFRYKGSLTTPACNEVVIWTVFRNTIPISSNQLEQFRQLVAADGSTLQDNFRNLQLLNGRQVYITQM